MSFLLLVTNSECVERPRIYRFHHHRKEPLDEIALFLVGNSFWKCQIIEIPDGELQFFKVEES